MSDDMWRKKGPASDQKFWRSPERVVHIVAM